MTREEAWAFCKLRAKYRAERRREARKTAEDAVMAFGAIGWFLLMIALTGIL